MKYIGLKISQKLKPSLHCITCLSNSVIILDFHIIFLFNLYHQYSESILLNFQRPGSGCYTWKRQVGVLITREFLMIQHSTFVTETLFHLCQRALSKTCNQFLTAMQQQRSCVLFVWIRSEQGLGGLCFKI